MIIGAPRTAAVVRAEAFADRAGRYLLRLDIDRRVNLEAALRDACRIFFFEILADLFDRIIPGGRFGLRLIVGRIGEFDVLGLGRGNIGRRVAVGEILGHLVEHDVAAHLGLFAVARRRVLGRFRNGGEQRGLFEAQVLDAFAEIGPRTGLETIGTGPEEDIVHIHLKDLVLGVQPLDLQCDGPFVDLSGIGLVLVEKEVLGQLLGDGRGTLGLAGGYVLKHGAEDAIRVNANVIAKTVIFNREQCVGHLVRHVLDLDRDALFDSKLGQDRLAVVRVDRGHLRRAIGRQSRHLDRVTRIVKVIRRQNTRQRTGGQRQDNGRKEQAHCRQSAPFGTGRGNLGRTHFSQFSRHKTTSPN